MAATTDEDDIRTNRTLGDNDPEHTIEDEPAVPDVDDLPSIVEEHPSEIADRLDWTADVHHYLSDDGDDAWLRDKARAFHRTANRIRSEEFDELDDDEYERIQEALEYYAENVDQTDWDVISEVSQYFL